MSEEEDYSKLPPEAKVVHKVWKVRVQGYEEAQKTFRQQDSEKSPEFGKYVGLMKGFVTDSNAVAQDKGLDAAIEFVKNAAIANKVCADVIAGVVTKCLNARPKTKGKGIALCLAYIEAEQSATTVEELLKGLENKQPKIVAGCLETLTQAIHEFGLKVVDIKPVVKALPKQFDHNDKMVREQAKQCAVELFRWIRDAIKPTLQGIKPVQLKELEGFWETVTEPACPTRFTRSEQAKIQANSGTETAGTEDGDLASASGTVTEAAAVATEAAAVAAVDAYDLLEAVNVLAKLPADFYENVSNPKWQIRKKALDELQALTQQPKLESGDFGELIRALKQVILKDMNVMIVSVAGRCVEGLAKGLRRSFQPYAVVITVAMLEKFKEKKQNVVLALRDAVDAVYQTTSLAALLEDILPFLDNKNPSVKAETLSYMARSFQHCTPSHLNKPTLKQLCPPLITRMDDTNPLVRDMAAEALATVLKVVGDKPMSVYMDGLDKAKDAKVREACGKVELKVKSVQPQTKPLSSETKKPKTPNVQLSREDDAVGNESMLSEPKKVVAKKQPVVSSESAKGKKDGGSGPKGKEESASKPRSVVKPPATQPPSGSSKPGGKGKKGGIATGKFKEPSIPSEPGLSSEEIETKAGELVPAQVLSGLLNSNWKERLAACEQFKQALLAMSPNEIHSLVFVHTLAGKKPGWKDSNFQVMKARFDLVAYIAENAAVFGKRSAACVLPGLVDKLADIKIKPKCIETLMVLSDVLSLNYVSTQVCKHSSEHKSPKVHSEALGWIGEGIKAFGFKIDLKPHVDFIKTMLAATNPTVRTAAITLLGVFHIYIGPQLRMFLEDEKPPLLAQIDTEFARVAEVKPPDSTRVVSGEEGSGTEGQAVSVADLMPRTDISAKIKSDLVKELSDKNWKVRGEALGKVSEILSSAKFITPALGDLPPALKGRLSDSNKNVVVTTVGIISNIATAMGSPVAKYLKIWGPGILNVLSDGKPQVRSAALATMTALYEEVTLVPFIEMEIISNALATDNPILRTELLHWLEEKLSSAGKLPSEFSLVVPPVIACLEDRNVEVRKRGQAILPLVMSQVGFTAMAKATSKLKSASKQAVMAILEKHRQSASSSASATKPEPSGVPGSKGKAQGKVAASEESGKAAKPTEMRGKSAVGSKRKDGTTSSGGGSTGKATVEEDSGPPLVASNKEKRHKDEMAMKVLKWNFSTPRDECTDQLKDQLQPCCSKTLFVQLFHADFKQHLAALSTLLECVKSSSSELISNLDLILKWVTLRFFETNTTVLVKCLEFLQSVFSFLTDSDYQLQDFEASAFLPYLVLKVGDPKDVVRKQVRQLMRLLCNVYPAGKMFGFIHDGLKSKNARQRTECLEELGCLIARYGSSVCQPSAAKALPAVAQNISDRDNTVRTAALNTLVEVYRLEGDKVYKLVGQLSEKDLSLLEERIKRSAGKPSPPVAPTVETTKPADEATDVKQIKLQPKEKLQPQAVPRSHSPSPARPAFVVKWDVKEEEEDLTPAPLPEKQDDTAYEELMKLPPLTYTAIHTEQPWYQQLISQSAPTTPIPVSTLNRSTGVTSTPPKKPPSEHPEETGNSRVSAALSFIISQISSDNMMISRQNLKQILELLQNKEQADELLDHVDQLVRVVTLQVQVTVNTHLSRDQSQTAKENVTRMMKHLAHTVSLLFSHTQLATVASSAVLHDLLRCMITLLLNEHTTVLEDSAQLTRTLNALVLKIIDNSNLTNCFSALLQLMSDNCGGEGSISKFVDLIMKCLWRMAKNLAKTHTRLHIDQVLYDIHQFLTSHPPPVWTSYASDTPLRTAKTILHRLAELRGTEALEHLALIPDSTNSYTYHYLAKSLKISPGVRVIRAVGKTSRRPQEVDARDPEKPRGSPQPGEPEKQKDSRETVEIERPKEEGSSNSVAVGNGDVEEDKAETEVSVVERPKSTELPVVEKESGNRPPAAGSPLQQRRRDNLTPRINQRLGEIFTKIGSKENTLEGLNELYDFRKKHPDVNIDPFMHRTSSFFQTYIERNLKRIDRERRLAEEDSSKGLPSTAELRARLEVLKADTRNNKGVVQEAASKPQPLSSQSSSDECEDAQSGALSTKKVEDRATLPVSGETSHSVNLLELRKRLDRAMASASTQS